MLRNTKLALRARTQVRRHVKLRTSSSENKSLRQWHGKKGIVKKIYERGEEDEDDTADGSSKKDDDTWQCSVCTLILCLFILHNNTCL